VTINDLLGAVRRRWPIMAVGVLLTLVTCLFAWREPGVYWASTKVYFLVPVSAYQPNQLAPDSGTAVAFAGVIQTEINGGIAPREATSPDVTLVEEGIYDGWSVLLPDTGGQWAHDFPESCLIVQASGPTPEVVRARMYSLIDRITRLVAEHEDAAQVPVGSRVEFTMSPAAVAVQYSTSHRSRAVPIVALVGVLLSLAACRFADRVLETRRPRGEQANDGIGDARVRDAAGGDQDGPGGTGADAPPEVASDRRGDRTAPGDAGSGQPRVRDRPRS
jgi:hypothetical protein